MRVSEEMFLAEHGLLKGIKMRVRVEFGHQGTEISQDSSSAGGLIGGFHQLLHGGGLHTGSYTWSSHWGVNPWYDLH